MGDRTAFRQALLLGLTAAPKAGIPGDVSVFGLGTAFCIVPTATNQCMSGGAFYGRGRVVAAAHNGYVMNVKKGDDSATQKFSRFLRNAVTWAAGAECQFYGNGNVQNDLQCIPQCAIAPDLSFLGNYPMQTSQCQLPVKVGGLGLDGGQLDRILEGLNGNGPKSFVAGGTAKNIKLPDMENLLNAKPAVVIWVNSNGGQEVVPDMNQLDPRVAKLLQFIAEGGGLINAVCPWGWEQVSGGGKLETTCIFNHVLSRVGLQFRDGYCGGDKNNEFPLNNLPKAGSDFNDAEKVDQCVTMISQSQMPPGGLAQEAMVSLNKFPRSGFVSSWPNPPGLPDVGQGLRNVVQRLSQVLLPFASKMVWPLQSAKTTTVDQVASGLYVSYLNRAWVGQPPAQVQKAPALGRTPGDVVEGSQRTQNHIFTVNPWLGRWQTTGLWCPGGEMVTVTISNEALHAHPNLELMVRCGVHTDNLEIAKGNDAGYKLNRWPTVTAERNWNPRQATTPDMSVPFGGQSKPETATTVMVATPFGGSLIIQFNKGFNAQNPVPISVNIIGGVLAPYWNTQRETGEIQVNPTLDSYPHNRMPWHDRTNQFGAPYGELEGKYIILTMPTATLKQCQDPKAVTDFWDSVIAHELTLSGQTLNYKERIAADVQISAGYMHNGYPVMTFLDVVDSQKGQIPHMIDIPLLTRQGSWGVFHEFGHNRQKPEWTFQGTGEVTVNIFSLYISKVINNLNPYQTGFMKDQLKSQRDYLTNSKKNFNDDWVTDPGCALGAYGLFINQFGFQVIADIFREYNAMKKKPGNDNEKRTEWVKQTSLHVKMDLRHYYDQWKWPYDKNLPQLDALPKYTLNVLEEVNKAAAGH